METHSTTAPRIPRPTANRDLGSFPTELALRLTEAAEAVWPEVFVLYRRMEAGPPMLGRKTVQQLAGWHLNTVINKEQNGTFVRCNDGRKVLLTSRSVYSHLIDLLLLANPSSGPVATVEAVQKAWEAFA
jgi:hypothetical protein